MSRTIGYNPDPTPNARRDSKGRFRIEVRVIEAMLAIVGHPQYLTRALRQKRTCANRSEESAFFREPNLSTGPRLARRQDPTPPSRQMRTFYAGTIVKGACPLCGGGSCRR